MRENRRDFCGVCEGKGIGQMVLCEDKDVQHLLQPSCSSSTYYSTMMDGVAVSFKGRVKLRRVVTGVLGFDPLILLVVFDRWWWADGDAIRGNDYCWCVGASAGTGGLALCLSLSL